MRLQRGAWTAMLEAMREPRARPPTPAAIPVPRQAPARRAADPGRS